MSYQFPVISYGHRNTLTLMGVHTIVNLRLGYFYITSAFIVACLAEVELDLKLKNTSPAVLDSNITFTAELYVTPPGDSQGGLYKYVWRDSTSPNNSSTTYGNGTSELCRLYAVHSMQDYKPGIYTMKVEVYKKINSSLEDWIGNEKPLAKGNISFKLTDAVNVSALLKQSLATVSPEGVYATNQTINVTTTVHEVFDTVDYTYEVYTNGSLTNRGHNPQVSMKYNQTGNTNISVHVIANITINQPGWPNDTHIREGWRNVTVKLKESVSHIKYLGESQYQTGKEISATFVCMGSPPFLFVFQMSGNIQPPGGDFPVSHKYVSHDHQGDNVKNQVTLLQPNWKAVCLAKFTHVFNESGSFTLWVKVQNEVGVQETEVTLQVVYPDEPMQPAIIAVCVVIAIISFVLILVVYLREQSTIVRTPNEETANHYFYFSPGEGTSETPSSPTVRKVTRPRHIKEGLSIMYSTAKNWVVSVASSHGSQTSGLSYDEL